jgi:hypothetical protein
MNTETFLEFDDLGVAVREGRPLYPARNYRFLLAQGNLNFATLTIGDHRQFAATHRE